MPYQQPLTITLTLSYNSLLVSSSSLMIFFSNKLKIGLELEFIVI